MKALILGLFLLIMTVQSSYAQQNNTNTSTKSNTHAEQEIINFSKQKWLWMADKNVDSLHALFDEKSVFVHMGGSWGKTQELNVIKSGGIHYKKADIHQGKRIKNFQVSINVNNLQISIKNAHFIKEVK